MLPEDNLVSVPENRLSSWRLIVKARQDFWKRWQHEYLSELQKRQKWVKDEPNLKCGTVALIIDKNQPCMQWVLGRIIEVYPGDDGIVRTATVQTSKGNFKRSVKLLCPLPIESNPT
jgi:hypothetical protein